MIRYRWVAQNVNYGKAWNQKITSKNFFLNKIQLLIIIQMMETIGQIDQKEKVNNVNCQRSFTYCN